MQAFPLDQAKPTPGLEPGPFITSVNQQSQRVAPSRVKPHCSKESAQPKWRPKTRNGEDVDPA
jgi:hypothetical protein